MSGLAGENFYELLNGIIYNMYALLLSKIINDIINGLLEKFRWRKGLVKEYAIKWGDF